MAALIVNLNWNKLAKAYSGVAFIWHQIQQPTVTMLGSGAIFKCFYNLKKQPGLIFTRPCRANQSNKKFQLTTDVNLNLENALGKGENIIVNWQQLQQKSPVLNLGYQHPYIFKSNFGIDFSLICFKRFQLLMVNGQLGLVYYVQPANHKTVCAIAKQFFVIGGVDTKPC